MAQRFVGGLRLFLTGTTSPRLWTPGLRATWPFAELVVDDQRVLLRLRWNILFGLVKWEAPRETVTAEDCRIAPFARGVLLKSPGRSSALFWCDEPTRRAVLSLLAA